MLPSKPVIDEFLEAVIAKDPDARKAAMRTLNLSYYEIAAMASWAEMRRSVSLTDSGYLPSDLIAIDAVYDGDGNFFEPRERYGIQLGASDPVRRWYYKSITTTPLFSGKGLNTEKDSATISTETALSSSVAGEYLVSPGSLGFFKMTDPTTLAEPWRGDSVKGAYYEVRPSGTKQFGLVDETGAADASTTVTVDYTAYPMPITEASGMILLPSSEVLLIHALRRHYKITKKDLPRASSFNDDFERALSEALARNPKRASPTFPLDGRGIPTGWGASQR